MSGTFGSYSDGLRHGYEDQARAIRDILAEDLTDAEKLQKIAQRVAERPEVERELGPVEPGSRGWIEFSDGAVIELPDDGIHDSNGDEFWPDEGPYDPRD